MKTQIFWNTPHNLDGAYVVIEDPQAARHTPQGVREGALGVITLADHGEAVKTLERAGWLYKNLVQMGLRRDGWILGVGGGTLGDLVGFVAATWLRGVPYRLMPTTLLAMVDSTIGGKTAVNLPEGKNLVGAFHDPEAVYLDLQTLQTLPERMFRAGVAEVVKLALIEDDEGFFNSLEEASALHAGHPQLQGVITRALAIKQRIVEADPFETLGPRGRQVLNLGHTVAHALEAATGYAQYSHGEAVAIGLCEALRAVAQQGAQHAEGAFMGTWALGDAKRALARTLALLGGVYGLPTAMPATLDPVAFAAAAHRDKKARHG